jgi:NAD+ synthase (glutamine-hydrolysing)
MAFHSPYAQGFFRVAACTPQVEVANPQANVAATLKLAQAAASRSVGLAVFPELGLSGYAIDDLLFQDALLDAVELGLARLCDASAELLPILVVGAPLRAADKLFNCAVVIHAGAILGVVPKTY